LFISHGKNRALLKVFLCLLCVFPAVWGCGGGPRAEGGISPPPPVTFFSGPLPRNIAHRGGKGLFPENTLHAFEHALAMGVQILETDVWVTLDGHVVLLHDLTVDRTTDGRGPVVQKPLAEVKELDAAYRFTRDGGETYPLRGQGITVPTLDEAFSRFADTPFSIEIKQASPRIEADVLAVIEAHGMTERVCVGSFHDPVIREVRRLNPDICTTSGLLEIILFAFLPQDLFDAWPLQAAVHQIPEEQRGVLILTPEFVARAVDRGMEVHVWTVNRRDDMERFLAMGVHGVITDYPDRLEEVIRATEHPPP
jgi:glycerophosphoryl diester phosphodiesterase